MRGFFTSLSFSSLTSSSNRSPARRGSGIISDDPGEDSKAAMMSSKSSRRTSLSSRFSLDSPTETSPDSSALLLLSGSGNPKPISCTFEESKPRSSCSFSCSRNLLGEPGIPMVLTAEDELLLYTGNELKLLSSSDFSTRRRFSCGNSPVKTVLVSEGFIFTAHEDLKIRAWRNKHQEEPKLLATLPSLQDSLLNYMLPSSHVQTRRHKKTLKIQHYDAIAALAMSSDGTLLYSGSWDRTIKAWRIPSFKCSETFQAHEDAVNALAASRDGYLYSASSDGTVRVWERGLDNKHLLTASFHRHQSGVNAVTLSGDEEYLYSGSADKSVIVWEREDSAGHMSTAEILRGHEHAVLCLASSGSSVLCSGSADKTVRI